MGRPGELVRGLGLSAFLVEGGQRDAVLARVEGHPLVRAASPAGPRLRIVLDPKDEASLAQDLVPTGAHLVPATLDFEDLYLARMAEREARA